MPPEQTGMGLEEGYAIPICGLMQICTIQPQIHSKGPETAKFRVGGRVQLHTSLLVLFQPKGILRTASAGQT